MPLNPQAAAKSTGLAHSHVKLGQAPQVVSFQTGFWEFRSADSLESVLFFLTINRLSGMFVYPL